MPVGDILQVRIETTVGVQSSENIRHYRVSSVTAPEATHLQIAVALNTIINPLYKAILSSSATYRGVAVRRVSPLPLTSEAMDAFGSGTGSVTGDLLPKQTCGVITLRTALAGRRYRGRFYAAFPGEIDNTAASVPGATYLTNLAALAAALIAQRTVTNGAGNSVLDPVIFHRRVPGYDNITSQVTRAIWGTQRRRGDYGRPNPPTVA